MISVIMAVYNAENCVRSAVDSILNQTYEDFEFIIINDCSTDNTLDILKSYSDKRIKIINNERNLGQTKSLNIGIREAKGEYMARMDADDFAFPAKLERQLNYITKHPEYVAVGTSAHKVYARSGKREMFRGATAPSEVLMRLVYATPLLHVSVMMHKDTILQVGGYDERFLICADYVLWSNLIRKGYKITSLPDVLMRFKVNEESYSMKNKERTIFEYCQSLMENINYLTNLKASYLDVRKLFSMFIVDTGELTDEEFEESQLFFKNIFLNLKDPWRVDIPKREIVVHLIRAYGNRATSYLKNLKITESRKEIYKAVRKYGVHPSLFLVFIATFLNRYLLSKLIRLRNV